MEILAYQSKTQQVIEIIRSKIKHGKYLPGSKLNSIRDLSGQFNVSATIISRALEQLEREKLITREHGRGVFVGNFSLRNKFEIFMLLWGKKDKPNNYFDELIKIAYPPVSRENFSIFIQCVTSASSNLKPLERELARIDNMNTIDCVLVNLNHFDLRQIEAFSRLNCPVVFLGDSAQDELNNLDINQVTGNNRLLGAKSIRFFAQKKIKEVTLFIDNVGNYFYKAFYQGVITEAEKAGIKLNLHELETPSSSIESEEYKEKAYKKMLQTAMESGELEHPVLVYALEKRIFKSLLEEFSAAISDNYVLLPEFSSKYFKIFYDSIFDTVEAVIKQPDKKIKRIVDIDFVLNDLNNNVKHLIKN